MEAQESSHLRFLVPGLRARIERSSRLVTGGRGSRRRVVCAQCRTRHRARTGQLSFCLAGRAARVQRNAHPARAATPFMFQPNGELSRARPRRNVDDCPPRNWCRLLVLIFRDALTSLNRGQEDEPTELGPGWMSGPFFGDAPAVWRRGFRRRRAWPFCRTEKIPRLFRNFAGDVCGGTQSSYECSGTVTGLPASARMTTRTLAGVVSLALRETA
jgi:hypothetical protein